jgi:PAS domain S-box-containing protein
VFGPQETAAEKKGRSREGCCQVGGSRFGDLSEWSRKLRRKGPAKSEGTHPQESPKNPVPNRVRLIPWFSTILFAFVACVVAGGTWFLIRDQEKKARQLWETRLSSVADDRARLVSSWLNERHADAEVLAQLPSVHQLLLLPPEKGALAGDLARSQPIAPILERFTKVYGYSLVSILDRQGRVRARVAGSAPPQEEEDVVIHREDIAQRGFYATLTGTGPRDSSVIFASPVNGDLVADKEQTPRKSLGTVVLVCPSVTSLIPLLAGELVPTQTGETLLARRTSKDAVFLSPLRFESEAIFVRRPLGKTSLAKLSALSGNQLFGEYYDYRGVSVLAAVRKIPFTDWVLVRKIDRTEALADFRDTARGEVLFAVLVILLFGAFLVEYRRRLLVRELRNAMEQHEAISKAKEYAQDIVDSVPAGLLVLSEDLHVLSVNRWFLETFRLPNEQVVGHGLHEVIQPAGPPRTLGGSAEDEAAPRDVILDLPVRGTEQLRPVRITMTNLKEAEDDRGQLLLVVEDMSESHRLQALAETSERKFRELIQSLDAIVWEADAETFQFTFVSQRAEALTGYAPGQWVFERDFWANHIYPEDREVTVQLCKTAVEEGKDHELEYRMMTAEGAVIWLRDIIHVVRDADGKVTKLRGLMVGITERKQLEEQLRQSQKMEAIGRLAGGIAHDFNNLLTIISGYSDLLQENLKEGDRMRAHVDEIKKASLRAATLTRQLLAFSRSQVLAPQVLDLNSVVANVEKMLRRLIGEDVELVTVLGGDLGRIKADPGQLEQVIMNLVVNARDAMPQGGKLTIETADVELDDAYARSHMTVEPGRYVMLGVSDTGTGMDRETQAHIFEPFFTTKEKGKGTGLGLATVYGIIKQSGGYVWVYSEPGQGATFKIYLPRIEAPAAAAAASPSLSPSQGHETILLAEDEPALRALARRVLESKGYKVLEARNGEDALIVADQNPGMVDLLLTDVVMPGMSGRELAEQLHFKNRNLKVLYMSGYTDDAIVHHGVLGSGMAFLQKPFTPEGMARRVRDVLDAPPAP